LLSTTYLKMRWEFCPGRLTAVDEDGTRVYIGIDEGSEEQVPSGTDNFPEGIDPWTGRAGHLTLPNAFVGTFESGSFREITVSDSLLEAFEPPVYFRVNSPIKIHIEVVSADKPVTVQSTDTGHAIEFSSRAAVRIGFESRRDSPGATVTVPRSIEGVATALSYAHRTTKRYSPYRTFPDCRRPPARIEWGTESIPTELSSERPTEVKVTVPPNLEMMYSAAPFVHYVGAKVEVDESLDEPNIRADGLVYDIDEAHEREFSDALQTVFYLDCLAREGGDDGERLSRGSLLGDLGLSAEQLFEKPMAERVALYFGRAPSFEEVLGQFPPWHFGVSVEPNLDYVDPLIRLLERLPIVRLVEPPHPEADRSNGFGDNDGPSELDIDVVKPAETVGRTHGWLAGGVPTGGIKLFPGCFGEAPAASDDIEIVVVQNVQDNEMQKEREEATSQYARRDEDLDLSIRVERDLTRQQLRAVFEEGVDLVHYMGHCNEEGLKCKDEERLSATEIDSSETTVFFLNACDSVTEAEELVRRGSVAGVATTRPVLGEPARRIGEKWAGMMMHGWTVTTALRWAEHALDESETGYVTVGDGTFVLTQSDAVQPPAVTVTPPSEPDAPHGVSITYDHPMNHGMSHSVGFSDERWLSGDGRMFQMQDEELAELFANLDSPPLVDGQLYWSDDLAALSDYGFDGPV
jgi:hypothetical protein